MSTHDKAGRPWAKFSELKAGDKLEPDGDFDCLTKGATLEVKWDIEDEELYVDCTREHGDGFHKHFLESHEDVSGRLIGFYRVQES